MSLLFGRGRCRAGKGPELPDQVRLVGIAAARGEIRPSRGGIPAREPEHVLESRDAGELLRRKAHALGELALELPTTAADTLGDPADRKPAPPREDETHGRRQPRARRASAFQPFLEKPLHDRSPRSKARRVSDLFLCAPALAVPGFLGRRKRAVKEAQRRQKPSRPARPEPDADRRDRTGGSDLEGARRRVREKARGLRTSRAVGVRASEVEDPFQAAIGQDPLGRRRRGVRVLGDPDALDPLRERRADGVLGVSHAAGARGRRRRAIDP